jgi:hypothetical protein
MEMFSEPPVSSLNHRLLLLDILHRLGKPADRDSPDIVRYSAGLRYFSSAKAGMIVIEIGNAAGLWRTV